MIEHSGFEAFPPYRNDIALIRLSTPAALNPNVRPVCLPADPAAAAAELHNVADVRRLGGGASGRVLGWGRTWFNDAGDLAEAGAPSSVLQNAKLPFVPTAECRETLKSRIRGDGYMINDTTQLCAGERGKDSCGGDSGGPLMLMGDGGNVGD